jgi:hypothetical protein
VNSGVKIHTYLDDAHEPAEKTRRKGPKPQDIYPIPPLLLNCLCEIAPKIRGPGAWWALGGDLAENLLGVQVSPTQVEILTDGVGVTKISAALSSYNATPVVVTERKLDRVAELDFKKYPIFERSSLTEFTCKGARVRVHGDYQLKVGEWDWGDPLIFETDSVNVLGLDVPLMPLRLKSEIYITLGWLDRATLISEAFKRAQIQTGDSP